MKMPYYGSCLNRRSGLACSFFASRLLLDKGKFWGGAFGLIPAAAFMYMSTRYTGQVINIELPLGIVIAVYYIICSMVVYKKKRGA